MQLEGIDHVAVAVRDIERSAKWYTEVLGFKRLYEGVWNGVPTFVGKGNTGLALFPASSNEKSAPSSQRGLRILHLAFRADRQNFSPPSANWKIAASNSNSKITKFPTPFISAIPTATPSRSRPMICRKQHVQHLAIQILPLSC